MCKLFVAPYSLLTKFLSLLAPLIDLSIRVWLFHIFAWTSGLNKLNDWNSTLTLFKYEYAVPLLPANVAAYLGTAGEIILPSLLLVGLFSRFSALGLFIFNVVALYAYPALWDKSSLTAAGMLHVYWGVMIAVLCVHGPGKLSIDFLLNKKCDNYKY